MQLLVDNRRDSTKMYGAKVTLPVTFDLRTAAHTGQSNTNGVRIFRSVQFVATNETASSCD